MIWGQGLWDGIASDPENPTLSTQGSVVVSSKVTLWTLFNVLELPAFPLCIII